MSKEFYAAAKERKGNINRKGESITIFLHDMMMMMFYACILFNYVRVVIPSKMPKLIVSLFVLYINMKLKWKINEYSK